MKGVARDIFVRAELKSGWALSSKTCRSSSQETVALIKQIAARVARSTQLRLKVLTKGDLHLSSRCVSGRETPFNMTIISFATMPSQHLLSVFLNGIFWLLHLTAPKCMPAHMLFLVRALPLILD